MIKNKKNYNRIRIKKRIRKRIKGTPEVPRLSVFRSNKYIYAQIIDDENSRTLISVDLKQMGHPESIGKDNIDSKKTTKIEQAKSVGKLIAEKAIKSGINTVVFDRNGYLYHGRIKSLAEEARKNGLKF
jgi:large subunit ribosomal protein L18